MTALATPPRATPTLAAPVAEQFETVACYLCGGTESSPFITAEDDLTGKPGRFTFVTCARCGLRYQNPRLTVEHIKSYYDDEYIAHRKKKDWGPLTGFFNWAMDRHDREKDKIVSRFVRLDDRSDVLDVGCAVGTFLQKMRSRHGSRTTGVDFKDLSASPTLDGVDFRCGLFYEQAFGDKRFDLVTMWHFLEHDYEPMRTLSTARDLLKPDGRLVIEVPRLDSTTFRLYGDRWPGLQAPQHTVLYDRTTFLLAMDKAGLDVVEYLPYGAFPAFFYFFAGAAFKLLRGKGLNLSRAIYPYFIGQILFAPVLAFEKRLNFAMQTVVCRRRA
jgi:SAM-dependent methyltransferase